MIYGNTIQKLCIENTRIQNPVEILELSANYQYDLAMIQTDLGIMNESAGSILVTIIKVIIKFLGKFSIVIGGIVAAVIAFIMAKNKESSSVRSGSDRGNKKQGNIQTDLKDDSDEESLDDYFNRVNDAIKNDEEEDDFDLGRSFKSVHHFFGGTSEKVKDGEKIDIVYKDWGALLENITLSTDAVIVLKAQAAMLVAYYGKFEKKETSDDQYELELKTISERIQKHVDLINGMVKGGKDRFFDKNFKAVDLVADDNGNQSVQVLDKDAINKLTDTIKTYRSKVEEKKFTFTYTERSFGKRFVDFDKVFNKDKEIKSLGKQLSQFNNTVKKSTKESISILDNLIKRIESSDEQDKRTMYTAELARFANQSMSAIAKISNVTVTEIGYCCSQYLVEKRRIEDRICGFTSDRDTLYYY